VLGPGIRFAVWFHGCSRDCPGCIAKSMNSSGQFEELSAEALYERVRVSRGIEGITLSGGEPLEQDCEELTRFLRLVNSDPRRLSVICFTGYLLEEVRNTSKIAILDYIDVLIDGPYIDSQNDNAGLRGSTNQRIHFLTERYASQMQSFFDASARNLEIGVEFNSDVVINGIPQRGFVKDFSQKLQEAGYTMEHSTE